MARGRADSMDLDDDYVPPVAHAGNSRRSSVGRPQNVATRHSVAAKANSARPKTRVKQPASKRVKNAGRFQKGSNQSTRSREVHEVFDNRCVIMPVQPVSAPHVQKGKVTAVPKSERMIEIIGAYKVGALEPNIVSFYGEQNIRSMKAEAPPPSWRQTWWSAIKTNADTHYRQTFTRMDLKMIFMFVLSTAMMTLLVVQPNGMPSAQMIATASAAAGVSKSSGWRYWAELRTYGLCSPGAIMSLSAVCILVNLARGHYVIAKKIQS